MTHIVSPDTIGLTLVKVARVIMLVRYTHRFKAQFGLIDT